MEQTKFNLKNGLTDIKAIKANAAIEPEKLAVPEDVSKSKFDSKINLKPEKTSKITNYCVVSG